ncbi:HNH endonuclease [Desulfocarbo indianensis]|nr:HNH endonuclease [Desulfocarbo indianensis]
MWKKKRYEGESSRKDEAPRPVSQVVAELKADAENKRSYREESLRLHGLICAKCGREFDQKTKHLLTVHHKDGNWKNNPRDGSNWENLCVYCHDDEHSRGI